MIERARTTRVKGAPGTTIIIPARNVRANVAGYFIDEITWAMLCRKYIAPCRGNHYLNGEASGILACETVGCDGIDHARLDEILKGA